VKPAVRYTEEERKAARKRQAQETSMRYPEKKKARKAAWDAKNVEHRKEYD
jgi:hypothetical protein